MLLETSIEPVSETTAVIKLSGAMTLGTSLKTLDLQIQDAIQKRGLNRLALEMSEVPYMDSAGLGALMHASGLCQENGGSLRLVNPTERVLSLLRMTKTDTLLPVDASVDAALSSLK